MHKIKTIGYQTFFWRKRESNLFNFWQKQSILILQKWFSLIIYMPTFGRLMSRACLLRPNSHETKQDAFHLALFIDPCLGRPYTTKPSLQADAVTISVIIILFCISSRCRNLRCVNKQRRKKLKAFSAPKIYRRTSSCTLFAWGHAV